MPPALEFVEARPFDRARDDCFRTDEAYRAFQNSLMANPRQGDVIPGTHGIRKMRWNLRQSAIGKRGGLRIAYLYVEEASVVLLMVVYGKSKQVDLSPEQKSNLSKVAELFRAEVLRKAS